jgi:LysM repeat protein
VAGVLTLETLAAAERVHTVVTGESAASLAKKYYGERSLGDLLMRYNDTPGKVIHPGQRLKIPYCEVYRARPGDTWSGLAKRNLGRAAASSTLAELNGYAAGQPLRAGARIVFPVVLRHDLARGETLSSIAERFYGDPHRAGMLQAFGRIDDVKRLAVGTPLEIPIVSFVRAETEQAAAATPPPSAPKATPAVAAPPPAQLAGVRGDGAATRPMSDDSEEAARRGRPSLAEGEYDRALGILEALGESVTREGGDSDRREWSRLMAFVYVARPRRRRLYGLSIGPPEAAPAPFDPDRVSPRIREVLSNCR